MKALTAVVALIVCLFLAGLTLPEVALAQGTGPAESLRELFRQNGYNDTNNESLSQFLRYGNAASATKALKGDQFDRHEIMEKQKTVVQEIEKKTFFLDNLTISTADNNTDINNQKVTVSLPFYTTRYAFTDDEDGGIGTGVIEKVGFSNADENNLWFLQKDETIRSCNRLEAQEIERRDGVVYMMQSPVTTLYISLRGDYETIKNMIRNTNEYKCEVCIVSLYFRKLWSWGAYKKSSWIFFGMHTPALEPMLLTNDKVSQPNYFVTESTNAPEVVKCEILSLKIYDKDDNLVGSLGDDYEKGATTTLPTPSKVQADRKLEVTGPANWNASEAGERKVLTIDGVEYAFRWCPPGTFTMGSPESEEGRFGRAETPHKVTLTKGFWMLETEVTQEMWESVMGNNPSNFKGNRLPVETVSWDDCQEFIHKLNAAIEAGMEDVLARNDGVWLASLPTEAQWEYACRAGTTTPFHFGSELNGDKANCKGNSPYGTETKGKYLEKTTVVGSYPANAWGLNDMHGNVLEGCSDWYGDYPSGAVVDPVGPSSGANRVFRGGSWDSGARYCRSASRSGGGPSFRGYSGLGLRLSLVRVDESSPE